MIVGKVSDAFGQSGVPFLDMAANIDGLSTAMRAQVGPLFSDFGLALDTFQVESLSLPDELRTAVVGQRHLRLALVGLRRRDPPIGPHALGTGRLDLLLVAGRTVARGRPARLLALSWRECVERIFADLERAHPDIRDCVSRIDVMRLGHAMVRPTVGFLSATSEAARLQPPGFHLANSDLSGLSLFEEAQFRGVSAARSVLAR